ncbi:MAG: FHA domain-containing protein [Verrucomicrobiales bacterium]|nr:FHA domain-containing protein [Verrucomicrobiales bacterium]
MAKCYHLALLQPDEEPAFYTLAADRVLLGRGRDSRIPLDVSSVSTRHCELERTDKGYQLRDLGSKNGTLVNGQAVGKTPALLNHGDLLVLGELVTFHYTESAEISDASSQKRAAEERAGREQAKKPILPPMVNPVAAAVAAATQKLRR